MAALARSRSAVHYDLKEQPEDSTAWPNTFSARGRSTRKSWLRVDLSPPALSSIRWPLVHGFGIGGISPSSPNRR